MFSKSHSDFLPLVQDHEFLPPISRWTSLGGMFLVGAVGIAIALASVTEYRITVKAQASLRPAGELRLVQAATEGQITGISVQENQEVNRGDIIATIDDSRLQTKKSQLQSNIQQAQRQLVQIKAQISALNSQIAAEIDKINRIVNSAQAELRRRQRDYRDRQLTSHAQVQEAEANLRGAQEELQKAQAELKSAQANLSSTDAALKAARSKRNRYQRAAQEGALSQDQLEEVQLAVEQQEQAVKAQKATLEAQKQIIERLQEAIQAARARLKTAQATLNPSDAEVAIAQQRIAQEKATGKATLATLNKEREALIQQRIKISKQLAQDTRELNQVEIDLNQTTIRATADGIISKLALRNLSQTVRQGEEIAQIVPTNAPLEIKAAVSPSDIGKLAKGQKVQMRVSACPYPDYGTLKGVVREISEDTIKLQGNRATVATSMASSQKGGAATAFYEVTVKPESLTLGRERNQCSLQLGMEGRADIVTRQESVLKFLLRKARLLADL